MLASDAISRSTHWVLNVHFYICRHSSRLDVCMMYVYMYVCMYVLGGSVHSLVLPSSRGTVQVFTLAHCGPCNTESPRTCFVDQHFLWLLKNCRAMVKERERESLREDRENVK